MKPKINAEWDEANVILVSTPGPELFEGILNYEGACFEHAFNTQKAREEHYQFRKKLEDSCGAEVVSVDEILSQNRSCLENLAIETWDYMFFDNGRLVEPDQETKKRADELKYESITSFSQEDLLRVIFEQRKVIFSKNSSNWYVEGYYSRPIMNHFFQRDQQIVTKKGVVIGNMYEPIRSKETEIAKEVFRCLDITPLYTIDGEGRLEGGDYLPAGDFALVGEGLRTNMEGINQLLDNDAFGFNQVVVVHDPKKSMDEMHLDTYFNIIGEKKAIMLEDRLYDTAPVISIYEKKGSGYDLVQSKDEGQTLSAFLQDHKYEVLPVSKNIQKNYGINVLTVKDSAIVAVEDIPQDYEAILEDMGVTVYKTDCSNLTKGYGGPHCMSQVLNRG